MKRQLILVGAFSAIAAFAVARGASAQAADGSDYSVPINPKFKITFRSLATNPMLRGNLTALQTNTTLTDVAVFFFPSVIAPKAITFIASKSSVAVKGFQLQVSSPEDNIVIAPGEDASLKFNGVTCPNQTGDFAVTKIVYESKSFPVPGGFQKRLHILALEGSYKIECDSSLVIDGTVTYADDSKCGAINDNGSPPENCTIGSTPGTGGDPGGTGGNGGTPTSSPQLTVVLPDDVRATPVTIGNSSTTTVLFSTFASSTATSDVSVSAQSDADDLLVSVNHPVIAAPGSGDEILTIRTTPTTTAGDHFVTITASDGITSTSATVFVTVLCDPPFILGIDQPKGSTVALGRPAQLSVKASGSGPFTYQWFTGASGLSNFPLPGGTSANFTTSALNDTTSYWVRITNPCGSVNSQTATVNVSASAKPTGRR